MSGFSLTLTVPQGDRDNLIADLWEAGTTGITEEDHWLRAFFDDDADAEAPAESVCGVSGPCTNRRKITTGLSMRSRCGTPFRWVSDSGWRPNGRTTLRCRMAESCCVCGRVSHAAAVRILALGFALRRWNVTFSRARGCLMSARVREFCPKRRIGSALRWSSGAMLTMMRRRSLAGTCRRVLRCLPARSLPFGTPIRYRSCESGCADDQLDFR